MTILVTGGSKCGKSSFAESMFADERENLYYIATMKPYGNEAYEAIERHRILRKGKGFETVECYTDLEKLNFSENSSVLLECMGNLLANEMFRGDEIINPTLKILNALNKISKSVKKLVIVTNEVGCDGISYTPETMSYISNLSEINRKTAEFSDYVYECVYGIQICLKGK